MSGFPHLPFSEKKKYHMVVGGNPSNLRLLAGSPNTLFKQEVIQMFDTMVNPSRRSSVHSGLEPQQQTLIQSWFAAGADWTVATLRWLPSDYDGVTPSIQQQKSNFKSGFFVAACQNLKRKVSRSVSLLFAGAT